MHLKVIQKMSYIPGFISAAPPSESSSLEESETVFPGISRLQIQPQRRKSSTSFVSSPASAVTLSRSHMFSADDSNVKTAHTIATLSDSGPVSKGPNYPPYYRCSTLYTPSENRRMTSNDSGNQVRERVLISRGGGMLDGTEKVIDNHGTRKRKYYQACLASHKGQVKRRRLEMRQHKLRDLLFGASQPACGIYWKTACTLICACLFLFLLHESEIVLMASLPFPSPSGVFANGSCTCGII
jgi:hypothetical protein